MYKFKENKLNEKKLNILDAKSEKSNHQLLLGISKKIVLVNDQLKCL